jgi:hypothetical protein
MENVFETDLRKRGKIQSGFYWLKIGINDRFVKTVMNFGFHKDREILMYVTPSEEGRRSL